MQNIILIVFLLLFLTAIVSIGFLFWKFHSWPPSVWKQRLHAKLAEYRTAIDKANDDPSAKAEERLRKERLETFLHAIPLERLADYPNIGPKTVEGLKDGGFKRIDQLWSLNWWRSVPGIGEVRAKSLTAAAKTIHDDAETQFDAGKCPEGSDWLVERDRMREGNRAAAVERDRIKSAALQAIRDAQPLVDLANHVTFASFLMHKKDCPVTDEVMNRPFPEMKISPAPIPVSPPPVIVANAPIVKNTPVPTIAPSTPIDDGQLERMRAYCRFGFVIARADGRVAVAEKKTIRSFLADLFGQDGRLLRHLDPVIEQCENPPPVEDDAVAAVKAITTPIQREELMIVARRIADTSGDRNQKEQDVLDRIAEVLGVGRESAADSTSTPTPANAREVLEIDSKVELSPELIRRRFNILTDQYDPKKAVSLGSAFIKKAEEMRAAVKAAAEALIAPFGVPLVPSVVTPPTTPTDIRHNPDLDAVFGT